MRVMRFVCFIVGASMSLALAPLAPPVASAASGTVSPAPPWSASDYDGLVSTTDQPDLAPAVSLPPVHVVYLYASDRSSQFMTYAARIQRDVRYASDLLHQLTGRSIRFDERIGADGRQFVDMTVLRSRYNGKQLESTKQFSDVVSDMQRAGLTNLNKKYLVYLDAASRYCGQSQTTSDTSRAPSNAAEKTSVSVLYQCYGTGGWPGGQTALHELTHAMGAVLSVAPHYVGSHCNDNANDVMCVYASTVPYSGGVLYDAGDDDYWDPAADPGSGSTAKLPWWTVNLSRFICPAEGCGSPNSNPGY